MAEDHGAPEAGKLFWTRDRRDRESPKSERRVVNQGQQVDAWLYSTNKALITVGKRIK